MSKLLFFLTAIFCLPLIAQDFKADVTAILKKQEQLTAMHLKADIKVYNLNQNSTLPEMVFQSEIKQWNNCFYSKQNHQISMQNERFSWLIDETQKIMVYKENKPKHNNAAPPNFAIPLDSVLKVYDKVSYEGSEGDLKKYKATFKKGGAMSYAKLWIDTKENYLKKMEYDYNLPAYNQKAKAIIEYTYINFSPSFDSTIFSEKKYFSIINNEATATGAYKNYQVIHAQ